MCKYISFIIIIYITPFFGGAESSSSHRVYRFSWFLISGQWGPAWQCYTQWYLWTIAYGVVDTAVQGIDLESAASMAYDLIPIQSLGLAVIFRYKPYKLLPYHIPNLCILDFNVCSSCKRSGSDCCFSVSFVWNGAGSFRDLCTTYWIVWHSVTYNNIDSNNNPHINENILLIEFFFKESLVHHPA